MNKFYIPIAILAILALVGFSLFFLNQAQLATQKEAMNQQVEDMQAERQQMIAIQDQIRQEQEAAERRAKAAADAEAMALAQAEKERIEREKLVNDLNARLAKEAEERKAAELAQQELEQKMAGLEQAQAESQAALAALEAESGASQESEALRQKMAQQEQQIAAMAAENKALKERQQLLEQKQIATEEAIMEAGGRVEIPYPEIRSPNARRREAIYFKERILREGGE